MHSPSHSSQATDSMVRLHVPLTINATRLSRRRQHSLHQLPDCFRLDHPSPLVSVAVGLKASISQHLHNLLEHRCPHIQAQRAQRTSFFFKWVKNWPAALWLPISSSLTFSPSPPCSSWMACLAFSPSSFSPSVSPAQQGG